MYKIANFIFYKIDNNFYYLECTGKKLWQIQLKKNRNFLNFFFNFI